MNWFYAYQGQRAGPVEDDEFARLVGNGTVGESTLVWHSGMPDWMPFSQARATVPTLPPSADGLAPATVPGGVAQAQCSQCGRVFPADDVIRLEGFNVCAECKPLLLQKMRQGISPGYGAWGALPARFGGFWIRCGALILDSLILSPLSLGLYFGVLFYYPAAIFPSANDGFLPRIIYYLVSYGIQATYEIFFLGHYGGTPGKLICGLRVVRSDGSKITYGRATGRYFARFLDLFSLLLGYLIAAFDDQKRALHDHVCDTRVVYKE